MRLIFAGTPPFAAEALTALHAAGHDVALVLTQPDRQAGRGMKLLPSATAAAALKLGLRIEKPPTLKSADVQLMLKSVGAEVMIVAAYGLILPQAVLDIPARGCLNIHGSLLPRWRGAAPVQRAIEAGDIETGIAIMQMDAGLDTGDVLLEKRLPIADAETSATLFVKLSTLGSAAIVEVLTELQKLIPRPQSAEGMTYAKKIEKSESKIDFSLPADVIERKLRAFDPFPGCEATITNGDEKSTLKIWCGAVIKSAVTVAPGTIVALSAASLQVSCGRDFLSLQVVQKPGGKRLAISDYLRGLSTHGITSAHNPGAHPHVNLKVGDLLT
jgi:methionyl-tRNA formyltransferase